MKRKTKIASVTSVVILFFVALAICILMFRGPEDSLELTIYTSFLASLLSLFTLVLAFFAFKDRTCASERYRERYIDPKEEDKL